jgi:hypothetical protein
MCFELDIIDPTKPPRGLNRSAFSRGEEGRANRLRRRYMRAGR